MDFGVDTPFSHVLNTNYSPSIEEQSLLRDLILGPEGQIRQLDDEISRLQAKRQRLQQFVDLHRALLSPFRRIPTDVWRLIFIETLPENILGLCTRTSRSSPLLLTTICHSWREIALSTPALWTSIHVHLPIEYSNSPDLVSVTRLHKRKEGLKVWLDRSGTSLPISISLAVQTYTLNNSPWNGEIVDLAYPRAHTTDFIRLLTQYSHRWGTVVFNSGVRLLDLTPLEKLPATSLSSLESFYSFGALFDSYRRPSSSNAARNLFPPSPLEKLLTKAHSLQRLELFDANISAATLSLPIPWHHLTELSIIVPDLCNRHESPLHPSQLLRLLAAKCQLLTTLNITLGDENPRTATASTISYPVRWPSLQSLRMVFLDTPFSIEFPSPSSPNANTPDDTASNYLTTFLPDIIQTFNSVTLPSLKKLSVAFYGSQPFSGYYAAQLPFEELLERSQCPLTHFEMIHPRTVAVEAVIRVLRQLETLRSLNLGYSRLTRRERTRRFDPEYNVEPRDLWTNPNVSSPWQREWLDRILREFLLAESDSTVESEVDLFTVLPLCPRLEELNIGGCALDDRDALLDFAMKTQRANLGTFRVDLGRPAGGDMWKLFELLRMERQDPEKMRVVQDVGAVTLDWRWDIAESRNPYPLLDDATTGLPDEGSWWNESLWL
ncbi:hypothetical protein PM082_023179 [Marasmius tenuissimus]|nr:hypothetical protein PM082_023179 [Marasmius tenuissimus]